MSATLPFSDLWGYLVWLAGFVLLSAGAGFALAGIWLAGQDRLTRVLVSFGAGVSAIPLVGLALSALHIPWTPVACGAAVLVVSAVLGRREQYRKLWRDFGASIPPLAFTTVLGCVAASLALAVVIQRAFAGFAASPHLHDASNHAFMVSQVVRHASLDRHLVFGPPYGSPPQDYLLGWHAAAALTCRLTGTLPHISAWYLAATCAALIPPMLTLAWRTFGLPPRIMTLAAGFAAANYFVPTNIFSWGGYGQIIGLSILPWVLFVLRGAATKPSWRAGLVLGLALLALLHIHTSELYTLLILVAAALQSVPRRARRRAYATMAAAALVVFVLGALLPLLPAAKAYSSFTAGQDLAQPPGWRKALQQFTTYAGGNVPVLQRMVLPGLVVGLCWRPLRRIAVTAAAMLLLFLGLSQVQDPVSLFLSRPFYLQAPRVIYPQVFLMPVLMAGVFVLAMDALDRIRRRLAWPGHRLLQLGVTGAVVVGFLLPGCYWSLRNMELFDLVVPYSREDARMAVRMRDMFPSAAVFANQDNDGSFWAMHLSRLHFLDPCAWNLGEKENWSKRDEIARLLDDPWPFGTMALKDLGARYVYVSDTVLPDTEGRLTRGAVDSDPRFRCVLRSADSSVYEILWDRR